MYDGRCQLYLISKGTLVTTRRDKTSLGMFAGVQLLAVSADRLKQFSFVAMLGLLAPGSSAELLKLNLFMQVPMLVFTPLVGALLDRWNKRNAIVGACVFRAAVLLLVVPLFEWAGTLYTLYALAAVMAVADLAFGPARSALIPELVDQERLLPTNATFWVLGVVGTLVGFLLGGWLFDFRSWQSVFYTNSLAYLVAAAGMIPVIALQIQARHRAPATRREGTGPIAAIRGIGNSIADSVRLIRADQHIAVSLNAQSALFAMGGVLAVIAIARIQEVAPEGKALFLGIIAASLVVGMIVSSALSGLFRDRVSVQRTISVATLVAGVAIAGFGRSETLVPLSVWAGLLGMSISPVFIVTETLIQHQSPKEHLGRVFAAREALIKTAYLTAAALATAVNAVVSKSAILVSLGLFLALLGVVLERTRWLRADEMNTEE
jgi:MFS family permease